MLPKNEFGKRMGSDAPPTQTPLRLACKTRRLIRVLERSGFLKSRSFTRAYRLGIRILSPEEPPRGRGPRRHRPDRSSRVTRKSLGFFRIVKLKMGRQCCVPEPAPTQPVFYCPFAPTRSPYDPWALPTPQTKLSCTKNKAWGGRA